MMGKTRLLLQKNYPVEQVDLIMLKVIIDLLLALASSVNQAIVSIYFKRYGSAIERTTITTIP